MEGFTIEQILHGCATTTEAVRRAIQNSQESLRVLAKRHGINRKRPVVLSITHNLHHPRRRPVWAKLESLESLVIHC